ncbi:ATP-dependent translocase ABCB1-like isoform X2 [Cydia pomonella]|uniref:ATP-dependent translocase ABCB1-like isoform X2 n=1 Tax=Cydia pomonella TaxID=82600 RepID=UPI002ADDE865|nr:ATP-dependent translocase ABCB1-like isoform X2 [Cydia pomonella]
MAKDKRAETGRVPNVSYYKLYRFATTSDRILICMSTIGSIVAGLMLPFSIIAVAGIFNVMVEHEKNILQSKPIDNAKFLEALHKFGINYSLIGLTVVVSLYIGTAFVEIAAINQIYQIKQAYLRAAMHQDMSYFDQQQTGDFASKMADDILKLEDGIGLKVSTFVYNITGSISAFIMAFLKGWKLTLLCLIMAPVTLVLLMVSGMIASRFVKKEAVESGRASAIAEEVISSVRTVYAYNGQEKEIGRYKEPLAKARQIHIKKDIFTGLAMSFLTLGTFCSYGLSFYFGTYLMIKEPESYNANIMFSVFFGVVHGLQYCGMAGAVVNTFGSACGAAAQIFRLIDNTPSINPYKETGVKPLSFEGDVDLKNVMFNYPTRPDVMVLKNINLSIKRGQSVALVGHSGCGKSSIIQLITRFYDVDAGSVRVDGHDVRELSVRWLRAQIGLVGQEPVLFNTTVRENIRYGREDASDADIRAAAEQANAHHFILKLPMGYDTLVGERGVSVSGGQKQRIAIARALVRNPSILLLDEATSALDMASEMEVQLALEKAAEGRTTVIVAHRLSTVRNANLICVMKDGVIAEEGTHAELVAKKGLYYDMVKLQEPDLIDAGSRHKDISISEHNIPDSTPAISQEDEKEVKRVAFRDALALNAPEWKLILVGCICGFVVGFTLPLAVLAFGQLFGSLSNPDPSIMLKQVSHISLACVGIGLAIGSSYFIQAVCFGLTGAHLTERLRLSMFAHMLRQDIAFFDERANSTGALCARLSAEAAHVQGATGHRISTLVQCIGTVVLSLGMALTFEWRVALVALAFVPLVLPVFYYQNVIATIVASMNAKAVERSTQIAVDALSNIRTVAALGREAAFVREYLAQLALTLQLAKRGAHLFGLVTGLSRAMFNWMNSAALVYGGYLVVYERLAYEKILITTQCIQMAAGIANEVLSYMPDFQKGMSAAARVLDLLHKQPAIVDPKDPVTGFVASGEIEFKEVEFYYPNRRNIMVLQKLNLEAPSGKTVALVGRSGCGKSTVIQLLLRYYDPCAGTVSLDGVPLPRLLMKDLRASFGLVAQEPVLFDLTIAENIAFGQNDRVVSRDEIIEVAKQANVHSFVVTLPQGYDTNIGKKGTQLSGGQKQRVAIARALLRKPRVLLLDEATSALDTKSEKVVQEALESAAAGRTCIMIAHRLSTVRDADLICVLQGGRIAERGTHQQLMDRHQLYYEMHTKQ